MFVNNQVTPWDQAALALRLLDHLGVGGDGSGNGGEGSGGGGGSGDGGGGNGNGNGNGAAPLHAVVGGSMGGMQALCLALLAPARWERLVGVATTGHTSPATVALRAVQVRSYVLTYLRIYLRTYLLTY